MRPVNFIREVIGRRRRKLPTSISSANYRPQYFLRIAAARTKTVSFVRGITVAESRQSSATSANV